jgi:hypothetical protein
MVSIAVLIVLFLVYYFPVTERQEASLNNRAFRTLAAVSDSLQGRIVTYVGVFERATKKKDLRPGQREQSRKAIEAYLKEQVPGLTLRQPDGDIGCDPDQQDEKGSARARAKLVNASYALEFRCGSWFSDVPIERMLAPYLQGAPSELFDEIVLADAEGTVLYQTLKTGNLISSLRSSTPIVTPASATGDSKASAGAPVIDSELFTTLSQSSSLWTMSLGGAEYKLYMAPLTVKVSATGTHLVVAGLMRDSRFRSESLGVPGSALVSLILLFLTIVAASWPLLKFSSMRPTERIARRSAVYFFLSILATVVLICALAIHLRYTFDLNVVDQNLENLSSSIEQNFESELRQALRVIESANHSALFTAMLGEYGPGKTCAEVRLATRDEARSAKANILALRRLHFNDYPYFDLMFWADSNGNQHMKWDVSSQPTHGTYVGDRSYFLQTLRDDLWEFSRDAERGTRRFRVDSVFSRTTGEYRAVISQRAPDIALCTDVALRVVSMVTPLMSLIEPVMPPDYGFALVDEDGLVLFHSVPTKNGRENLLNEVDDPRDLRAAIFTRQGRHLTARYLSSSHRMFVTPLVSIRQSPWTLITFHNLSARSSQHLERMLLFSALVFAYLAGVAVLLMLLPGLGRAPTWIWPREEMRGTYVQLILGLLLIAPALYLLIFSKTRLAAILAIGFLIPVLGVGIAILKLKSMHRIIVALAVITASLGILEGFMEARHAAHLLLTAWLTAGVTFLSVSLGSFFGGFSRPSLQNSFAGLCALALVFTGILPCVAFFKVAYDFHENLSTRGQQLQVVDALTDREERIKARYDGIQLIADARKDSADLAQWLFLRRRLESTTDRYDLAFLSVKRGQIFAEGFDDSVCRDDLSPLLVRLTMVIPVVGNTLGRDLSLPASANPTWRWCREARNRLRLTPSGLPGAAGPTETRPATRALFQSVRNDLNFLHPEVVSELLVLRRWPWAWAAIVFLAAWGITFGWVKPTLQQLFLFKLKPQEPLPEIALTESTPISQDLILLGFDEATVSATLRRRKDTFVIDFAGILRGQSVQLEHIGEPVVAIEHFDYGNDNQDANRKKLDILETLVALEPGKHVLIVTTVDPVFYFGDQAQLGHRTSLEEVTPGQDLERWSRALLGFRRVRIDHLLPCETGDHGRIIWSSCTMAERVVLYQLAHDGWINPKNEAAIEQLQLRGLIKGMPFHFTDEGLRKFVSRSVTAENQKIWVQHDSASLWQGIRLMFIVLVLGLTAVVLFFNQQSILGLIVTGLSILTPLTKLLTEASSFRALLGFDTGGKK